VRSIAINQSPMYSKNYYFKLINTFNDEFSVLLNVSEEQLSKVVSKKIADAILVNREGKIKVKGGYDGVYGTPLVEKVELNSKGINSDQKGLGDFI